MTNFGLLKCVSLPSTAGNATYTMTAPNTGRRYLVHGFLLKIVCDATVATRTIRVHFASTDLVGNPYVMSGFIGPDTLASATSTFGGGPFRYWQSGTSPGDATGTVGFAPIPVDRALIVTVTVNNGVAGDALTGALYVEDIPA